MIETQRLVIRPPTTEEREQLFAYFSDPGNERVGPDATPEQIRAWADGIPWGVWERETGELVGDCSLFFADEHGEWELAYGIRRDRWGRGYASEAAQACVRHGFDELGLARIVADVEPTNAASIRVLEKCGFVRVDGGGEYLLYAVTR